MSDFPARLLSNWDIPEFSSFTVPPSGTMNETWLLKWPGHRAALRRHRLSVRADVEFEHRVLGHARLRGIPCPEIIPTRQGDSLVEDDGRLYSLYTWAPGSQVPRSHLDAEHAQSMGSMLARIHVGLAELPGGPEAFDPPIPLDHTLGRIEELIRVGRTYPERAGVSWAIDNLAARARWLSSHCPSPPSQPTATSQVIHGDYQDTNVFFVSGQVSCVIDWDKARREVPAREVVRAMDHGLGMKPLLCRQFLKGYREVAPLSQQQLEEAADWFSYSQAHSLWVMEQLLVHNHDRVAGLVVQEPFKPFADLWAAAALT